MRTRTHVHGDTYTNAHRDINTIDRASRDRYGPPSPHHISRNGLYAHIPLPMFGCFSRSWTSSPSYSAQKRRGFFGTYTFFADRENHGSYKGDVFIFFVSHPHAYEVPKPNGREGAKKKRTTPNTRGCTILLTEL